MEMVGADPRRPAPGSGPPTGSARSGSSEWPQTLRLARDGRGSSSVANSWPARRSRGRASADQGVGLAAPTSTSVAVTAAASIGRLKLRTSWRPTPIVSPPQNGGRVIEIDVAGRIDRQDVGVGAVTGRPADPERRRIDVLDGHVTARRGTRIRCSLGDCRRPGSAERSRLVDDVDRRPAVELVLGARCGERSVTPTARPTATADGVVLGAGWLGGTITGLSFGDPTTSAATAATTSKPRDARISAGRMARDPDRPAIGSGRRKPSGSRRRGCARACSSARSIGISGGRVGPSCSQSSRA